MCEVECITNPETPLSGLDHHEVEGILTSAQQNQQILICEAMVTHQRCFHCLQPKLLTLTASLNEGIPFSFCICPEVVRQANSTVESCITVDAHLPVEFTFLCKKTQNTYKRNQ